MSFNIGLTGLYAANKSLDVAGNNIANVATVGFKSSRAEFADQYSNSIRGTSGSSNVGSGVYTSTVSQQFTQGALTTGTGRDLDLAINGNGFFMMSNNGEKLYTRAGSFHTDSAGYVVDNSGNNLQGYSLDGSGNVAAGVLTDLRVDSSNMAAKATSTMKIESNLDSTKPIITAAFDPNDVTTYTTPLHTPIYDSQGNSHTLDQYFAKTGTNSWTMYSLIDGRNISNPGTTPVVPDQTTITFDSYGKLVTTPAPTSTPNVGINADGTYQIQNWTPATSTTVGSTTTWTSNGAVGNTGGIKLDMLATTQNNATSGASAKSQNGNAVGQISAMNVDSSGNLFATYTNGQSKVIGQVSLTSFANVQGLAPAGGTAWRETFASGVPVSGSPQTGTLGNLTGSALEESNVDLTGELVNLIKAQSNYQANAKTISTQSTIMQTTIQMT
ncbi:flagellar hook protein FlgE [Pseudomonas huanghezhanensis]|uniref:flagellar hook protein FlgE n=1 Tax=Pseudomonas huanghezhanensis TaxID=3002903 RepID=UPI0022868D16|nr:flagellar hook protein FlgE [Pseudomonas sp. BSw22131]